MFCPNCGNSIAEGGAFCPICGEKVTGGDFTPEISDTAAYTAPEVRAPQSYGPVSAPVYSNGSQMPGYSAPNNNAPGYGIPAYGMPVLNPGNWAEHFVARWKTFVTSPVCLILLICYTAMIAASIFGFGYGEIPAEMYQLMEENGVSAREVREVLAAMESTSVILGVIGMIPSILMGVSMWMIYLDANSAVPKLRTSGMNVIKVMYVIALVLVCVVFGFSLLLILVAVIGATAGSGLPGMAIGIIAVVFVILLVVMALVIGYYVVILKVINAVKISMETFIPTPGPSTALGVICIISAVLSLGSLAQSFNLGQILSVACSVLYGLVLFSYKNTMEELSREYYSLRGPCQPR